MKYGFSSLLAGAALLTLSACSGADNDQTNAADNSAMSADADATTAAQDPNNPFAKAEQRMDQQMMAAVGANASDTWVRKMIVHHQGAIDMSKIMLEQNPSGEVGMMARDAITKQTKEIKDLQKLLQQGTPNPKSGEIYRSVEAEMKQAMMQARGATVAETFMKKMLAHHEGGAELADVALDKAGVTGALRAQIEKTHEGQHHDAEMTEAMIGGATMQQAMKQSGAKTAKEAKPKPAPTATSMPADHDMDDMSDMSGMDHK
jgi:uncharacterized protein (DUF305 family)